MEVALRQRLDGVADIAISQGQQTAEVRFQPGSRTFSPEAFRTAVGQADVEVLAFRIDACGTIEQQGGERWLDTGGNRFRLTSAEAAPVGQPVCASGRLDDRAEPPTLEVKDVQPSPR